MKKLLTTGLLTLALTYPNEVKNTPQIDNLSRTISQHIMNYGDYATYGYNYEEFNLNGYHYTIMFVDHKKRKKIEPNDELIIRKTKNVKTPTGKRKIIEELYRDQGLDGIKESSLRDYYIKHEFTIHDRYGKNLEKKIESFPPSTKLISNPEFITEYKTMLEQIKYKLMND